MEGTQILEDNDILIEEMITEATNAPEPGDNEVIVHKGDKEQPAPMTMSVLASAGWVYIYETKNGEMSVANRNMLPMLLKLTNPDGKRRFTTRKPNYAPKQGTIKCMLHTDSPERSLYDEMGLPYCRKSNMQNKYSVIQHMQKRHPMEWKAIEQNRIDIEKQEEREFRQSLMSGNASRQESIQGEYKCSTCGKECGSPAGLSSHKRNKNH